MRIDESFADGGVSVDTVTLAAWPSGWLLGLDVHQYEWDAPDDDPGVRGKMLAFVPSANVREMTVFWDADDRSMQAAASRVKSELGTPTPGLPDPAAEYPLTGRLAELAHSAITWDESYDDADALVSAARVSAAGAVKRYRGYPDYQEIAEWCRANPDVRQTEGGEWSVLVLVPVASLERFRSGLDGFLAEEYSTAPRVVLGQISDGTAELRIEAAWK